MERQEFYRILKEHHLFGSYCLYVANIDFITNYPKENLKLYEETILKHFEHHKVDVIDFILKVIKLRIFPRKNKMI